MDHIERVQQECTRQAEHFAASAKIVGAELTRHFVDTDAPDATMRILDVACGPGPVTAALAPQGREVVALEVTWEMLRRAAAHCCAHSGASWSPRRHGSAPIRRRGGVFHRWHLITARKPV